MACYIVFEVVEVTKPEDFQKYGQRAVPNIVEFGGKLLAAGQPDTLEGGWKPKRIGILEFPSVEQAKTWYHSPEYSAIKQIRQGAAVLKIVLVPGWSA